MKRALFVLIVICSAIVFFGCSNLFGSNERDPSDITSIEIATTPQKTVYKIGEEINLAGIRVNNIYNDGEKSATQNYTYAGDTFRVGERTITVSAKSNASFTAAFQIEVTGGLVDTGLPVIYIDTNDEPILNREDWVSMEFKLDASEAKYDVDKTGFTDQIRGRGHSTWNYPKKPYRIRFRQETSLFGLTAARNWVLLANYRDPTLLANTLAFRLGELFGFPWTNHYIHVELVLNGEYQGSYLLTEHSRVGPGRVDIDPDEGFLIEADLSYDEPPRFRTPNLNLPIMISSPGISDDASDPGYAFVRDTLNAFDAAISDSKFPDTNWKDIVDVDSLVDYLMINEIVYNFDMGYPRSVWMYKDVGEKMKMGPLWDFDWAFGLWKVEGVDYSTVFLVTAEQRFLGGDVFTRFHSDPVFTEKYKARWNEKLSAINTIPAFVDTMHNRIRRSSALDNRRWPGRYDNAAETAKLKTWYTRRVSFLNRELNAK